MPGFQRIRKALTAFLLVGAIAVLTACGGGTPTAQKPNAITPTLTNTRSYSQLERGNTQSGQSFGNWVVTTAKGLVQDAYVRDNNKLGVVITPQVRPNEVKDLARSLAQGFHKNFPDRDLKVLMYAPDKQLIMTAEYDVQSNQINYKAA